MAKGKSQTVATDSFWSATFEICLLISKTMTYLKPSMLSLVILVCGFAVGCENPALTRSGSSTASTGVKKAPPIPTVQPGEEIVVIETESFGKVKIQLFPDVAPKHVENFKKLIHQGFYDGLAFHRVIPDNIIQGGDPTTRGNDRSKWGLGEPGQPTVPAEFNDRPFVKGTLGAARSQDPNSASSQFFLCYSAAPQWDGEYTNFGQVIEGISNVQVMSNAPRDPATVGQSDTVQEKIVIKRMYLEKYQPK
jgi:cyclophilin family peptidyl-prolyl cis-trans isomerase